MKNEKFKMQNARNCLNKNHRRCFCSAIYLLHFTLVLLVISLLTGCGEKIESTSYYYNPSWTNAGRIIYIYGLESIRKDAIGTNLGSSYAETVMTMNLSGTDESFVFAVDDEPPYAMSYSPNREYVAYLTQKVGEEYYKIVIRSTSTEAYTAMQKTVFLFSPKKVRSFDWSDDGDKIVYCTSDEVRVRAWNNYGTTDTLVTSEADLKFVSWKYGKRIAFTHGSPEVLSLIYEDRSGRVDLPAAASVSFPQISPTNTDEVYGILGNSYYQVKISSLTTSEILADFKGALPRISPDGKYAVYSKVGENSGIYLLDIDRRSEIKIK